MYRYFIGGPLDLIKKYESNKPPLYCYAPIYKGGSFILTNEPNLAEPSTNKLEYAVYELMYIIHKFGQDFSIYVFKG